MPKVIFFGAMLPLFLCTCGFGDVVNIVATGQNSNVETISQITMNVTTAGNSNIVSQNTPASGPIQQADSAQLQSVTIPSGDLTFFSPVTPTVTNDTFPDSASGIEVLYNGGAASVSDANFLNELASLHSNGDLLNYLRVDGGNFEPQWDIRYSVPINVNDYLVVEERDGNTTFTVQALDSTGNLIADADSLSFDGSSYQWPIGMSHSADPFGDSQGQVVSVIDFSLFNTTTPIGGFRINNTGNADFKFFIASAVPEPGSISVLGLLLLGILARRKRVA